MPRISESDLMLNADGSVYHLNLLPKHVADTVIGVGDPGRVYDVSKYFDEVEFEMNKREFITHVGRHKGKRVTVISTGIGTDNVEIVFSELDALVNIDLKTREPKSRRKRLKIIRIGTCGALQEDIAVGSYIMSDYAVGLDNLMTFYDLPMDDKEAGIAHDLQRKTSMPFMPYVVRGSESLRDQLGSEFQSGNTVTCPGFYAPQGRILRAPVRFPKLLEDLNYYHKDDFWLSNFEMETSAYYALGRMMGHEVQSVSAVLANRIKNRVVKDHGKVVDGLIRKVLDRI